MGACRKLALVIAVVLGTVASTAVPASAMPATVKFTGWAFMCADTVTDDEGFGTKPTAPGCPIAFTKKDGTTHQSGHNGLYHTGQNGGQNHPLVGMRTDPTDQRKWRDRRGLFQLSDAELVPLMPSCLYSNTLDPEAVPDVPKRCNLNIMGRLAPVGGIGASCDVFNAHSGNGYVGTPNGLRIKIENFGGTAVAGGVLPVSGTWRVQEPGYRKKGVAGDNGAVVGMLKFQAGALCVKAPANAQLGTKKSGQSTARVLGSFSMV